MVTILKHQRLANLTVSLVYDLFSFFTHYFSTTADVNYQTRLTQSGGWLWSRLSLNALIQHLSFSLSWVFLCLKVTQMSCKKQARLCIESFMQTLIYTTRYEFRFCIMQRECSFWTRKPCLELANVDPCFKLTNLKPCYTWTNRKLCFLWTNGKQPLVQGNGVGVEVRVYIRVDLRVWA